MMAVAKDDNGHRIVVEGRDLGLCPGGEFFGYQFRIAGRKPVVSLVRSTIPHAVARLKCDETALRAATGLWLGDEISDGRPFRLP